MKKIQVVVGIDVSKSTLDLFVRNAGYHFILESVTNWYSSSE